MTSQAEHKEWEFCGRIFDNIPMLTKCPKFDLGRAVVGEHGFIVELGLDSFIMLLTGEAMAKKIGRELDLGLKSFKSHGPCVLIYKPTANEPVAPECFAYALDAIMPILVVDEAEEKANRYSELLTRSLEDVEDLCPTA
jgi:hypothetical protein